MGSRETKGNDVKKIARMEFVARYGVCFSKQAASRRARAVGVFAQLALGAISFHPLAANAQGIFTATGSMTTTRYYTAATPLQNGEVLVLGGDGPGNVILQSAEIYNPATGTFSLTGSMTTPRVGPTATLLNNGQVLVTGGSVNNQTNTYLASAELYNPATGTFTATGSMSTMRSAATATLLPDGTVLIAGGNSNPSTVLASAEIYNPATGTFSLVSPMTTARTAFTATLLQNGQVLLAGGSNGSSYQASAELYNPTTSAFSPTGSMNIQLSGPTATLLNDGQVLIAGGGPGQTASAELYNPTTGTFTLTGSMMTARSSFTATLLEGGSVLMAGGDVPAIASAELYNPATGTFSATASLITASRAQTATLLPSGLVLVAGGYNDSFGGLASAELYQNQSAPIVVTIVGNGSVQDNQGPIINCTRTNAGNPSGTCSTTYSANAGTVTMLATPGPGFTFFGWTTLGSPTCVASGNTCSFTTSGAADQSIITATFFGPAAMLGFSVPPSNGSQGIALNPVTVQVEDAFGNVALGGPASTAPISIAIGTNPAGGSLFGVTTVNAVNGVATFNGLVIDKSGNGYTLTASSAGLSSATSPGFSISSIGGGRVNEVDLDGPSGALESGVAGNVTYLVDVTYTIPYHGGGKGTATLSITNSLPAGVTASFDPPSLYFCCEEGVTTDLQSTLTITSSAGTPAGTTKFIVAATSDYGGGAITEGTLVVGAGGTSAGSGSSANVCPTGQTTPAPCSVPMTAQFSVPPGTTFGANSVNVVTQGTPNLDFTLASTTCTGTQSSCTVNVNFAPLAPGSRLGAVTLTDSSGNPLASIPISGIGNGPAIAFGPGVQSTLATNGLNSPDGIAVDSAGDVFISDYGNNQVVEVTPGGVQTTVPANGLGGPFGIAVDGAGDVFIADANNSQVVEVTPGGVQTTVPATGLSYPTGVAVDGAGDVFIADANNSQVVEVTPGGVQTTVPANGLGYPYGVAVDGAGDVFIADQYNHQVVEVTPGGVQTTVPATGLTYPVSVAVDAAGDVFISDVTSVVVVEVTPSGVQTTVPSNGVDLPYGVALDGAGDIFIADANDSDVVEVQRSGAPSLTFASTNAGSTSTDSPQSLTAQNIGNQPLNAIAPGLVVTGPNFVQVAGTGTPADCAGSFALAPGASCNLSLSFTPQSGGSLTGTAVFADNALNARPSATQSISLAGVATASVPNVVGQTQATATSAITAVGLVLGTVTSTSSSTVPVGSVISESPVAGTQVSGGTAVNLVISTGVSVPNVVGQTQAAATSAITGAGLTVTTSSASSSTVPIGSVISESPSAGTSVNGGSAVNLVISTGVAVPGVVGQTQAAATSAITGAGLVLGTVTSASSNTVPVGSVISESPSAGTSVSGGSAVNLVISTGVTVPNVVGQTQAAATSAITGVGLTVTTSSASSSTVPVGSVISESPSAGTSVSSGSAVSLVISTGVAVPNVVGQTQAAAASAITSVGLTVTTSSASSITVPVGSVISESPTAGTAVNGGSAVNLVISTGVAVPNVVGQTQTAATSAITAAGLVLGTVTTASSTTVPSGSVISENPSAGTKVNGGSAVALVVSTGLGQYLLTTGASPSSGGTVSPATGNQNANSAVALKATPSAGYVFSSWTGPVANPTSASTTVTMSGPESVTANFISELTVSPSSIAFGTVYLGSITTKNITLTNTGTTPISINTPLLAVVQGGNSEEFVALNLCPPSLAAGSHCTISIAFVAGPFYTPQTATLNIMDNAPGNPQTVVLTATVIAPGASLNPTSLSFGNQTVNTSVTKTVTLKNTGFTTLSLTGMAVTGTNAAQFTLSPASSCGSSLATGASCAINVTFTPVAKVAYSATLTVTDNALPGTQTVPLSGTGH